jgi:hypothetical protein
MHQCRHCGKSLEDRFRFCPWCSAPQRTKVVEFFAPHPAVQADAGRGLRLSRYFGDDVRPPQFRFSIWSGESADAAISLSSEEAARLACFIRAGNVEENAARGERRRPRGAQFVRERIFGAGRGSFGRR